ncbi:MAG: ABC transporter permease [Bacteroidetes bacterium]|nr:ABC transporter permease [Bacteroidota bacterium]
MLKNYFKIAWRNIIRNRFYSGVNIFGLSIGIAFTLLISAYIWSQLIVNKDLKNIDRQYIIQSKWKLPDEGYDFTTLGELPKALKNKFPDLVANYFRWDGITSDVSKNDKAFREDIAICDSTFLGMYGFKLLQGNATTALNQPFSVVMTKDMAMKYFGILDVVGQTITIASFSGSKHDFMITGVLDHYPNNSVTDLIAGYPNHIFVSSSNLSFFGRNMNWGNPHIAGYIQLQKGVSPEQLAKPISQLIKENAPERITADLTAILTPLKNYYPDANNGLIRKMILALSAIALFILLMAVINFINMSVSRSASRIREIGIRKVLGGMKTQLIFQFLIESVVIVFIATAFAFIIYTFAQNWFRDILGQAIPSLASFPLWFIIYPVLFILVLGIIAGIYPAFILSSLKSVESLKGKLTSIKDHFLVRKSLMIFQFTTALVAIVGAIIISEQVNLFLHSNLGYNKDYIISAQLPRNWTRAGVDKMETIRNEFASMPSVKNVSLSFEIPNGNNSNTLPIFKFGSDSTQAVAAAILEQDEKFLSLYQIPVVAGTSFEGHRQDSLKVILNETAVHALGWNDPDKAIGQQVRIPGNPEVFEVRGVMKDFHFGSMQSKIPAIIMFNLEYDFIYRFLSFKINPGNVAGTIAAIQKKWNKLLPGAPFEYKFMDEALAKMYQSEIQLKKAAYTATILALIIVLLGVVGLVSLNIQKRTKEIGIRKVLGSSVAGIIVLFMKEFFLVIIIGGAMAYPLSNLIMNRWLQDYAYRINITAAPFIISIVSLGIITALLICFQTIKAAIANPVKSLRSE